MKNPIIIGATLLVFILVMTIMNDAKEDTVEKYWEDPSVFQVNRLPARAHFFPFESKPLARGNDRSKSNYFQSLNGTWKFHMALWRIYGALRHSFDSRGDQSVFQCLSDSQSCKIDHVTMLA